MKSVRSLAFALAVGGLTVTGAFAQYGGANYPSTGRYNAPTLLPLPQASGPWVQAQTDDVRHASSGVVGEVSPAANYAPQGPAVTAAAQRPTVGRAPSVSNPYYPQLSYNAVQEPIQAGPPAPIQHTPTLPPAGPPVMGSMQPEGQSVMGGGMAANPYEAAASDGCWGGDCGCDVGACCPSWYGYVGVLAMGRDDSNKTWTTFETGNNANQLLFFPDAGWGGGGEVTLGYTWCGHAGGCGGCDAGGCADACGGCGSSYRHGIEITYWGVMDLDSEASIRSETDSLSTPIDLGFVDIVAPGSPAGLFFDNAREHRLRRENEFHNVEFNFVDYSTAMSGRDLTFQWLVGPRFFRFDETLQFGTVSGGNEFGANGGLEEAYLDVDVENNLYGLQIGGRGDWRVHCKWRLFAGTKVGVFANDIDFHTRLTRGDGALATFASTGNAFDLGNTKTDVSMMGQIDMGVGYDITCNCSLIVGYRAVGITGLALADDQVPAFLAAEGDWTDIESNGSMILHGGFAGLEFRY